MRNVTKKLIAVILCAVMICSVLPMGAFAAEDTVYTLYPAPHEITYGSDSFELKDLNVLYGDGIDEATEARLEETAALRNLSVSVSQSAAADKTNVYVAIYGSGDAVEQYILANYTVDTTLFTKTDANFVAAGEGEIVVLGRDVDSCFYGLTTIYQIFGQLTENTLRSFTINDYADVASRGFIEGYYGNPWSTEDRINLMTWGGYYKLNSYFYAPKDDPKHNANWRSLYTDEELETLIKPLAEAGNASKCRFVYALHPYMHNAIRYSSEAEYRADLQVMQAKFAQVIQAGVRQIAILADDAGNVGGTNYVRTLNDMTTWLEEMQEIYPDLKTTLPFVTQEYMNDGVYYPFPSYYTQFPDNIQIVMTGGRVWGEVNNSFTSTFTSTVGRGPYLWINWPCTDNSKNHLIMGGYTTFLQTGVEPSNIEGIVLNPMQQSEPSKIAIFGNACYSWNIWETTAEADAAYDVSFACADHNTVVPNAASNALKELSKHMINQNMDSRVTALQESVDLKDELNQFKLKMQAGTLTQEDIDSLTEEFTILQTAAQTYRADGNEAIAGQIVYWLDCWDDTTEAILAYLEALSAILNNQGDAAIWDAYARGQAAYESSKSHALWYLDHYEYAEVGVQHIVPLMEAMDEYLAEIAADIVDPERNSSTDTGTAISLTAFDGNIPSNGYYQGSVLNLVDGNPSTFVWYNGYGAVGQYVGVDLGSVVKLGTVTFTQDSGDNFDSYELQYSTDGSSYTSYATYSDAVLNADLSSANIEARYIRFYNKTATATWTKIYEIAVTAASGTKVITNNDSLASHETSVIGSEGRLVTTGSVTLADGEYIGLDLGRIKDLATIAVADQGALTLQVSKNQYDWTAVTAGNVTEDGRYVRLINETGADVTVDLSEFVVTSNELSGPSLYDSSMGINNSWGVAEDCRNNGAAFDSDVSTMTEFGDLPQKDQYIIYDLGQERNIYKLEIYCADSAVNYIRDAVMQVSNDRNEWTTVLTIGDGVENTDDANVKCIDSDAGYSQATSSYPNYVSIEGTIEATAARYIRILMTATNNNRAVVFNEIEINDNEYVTVTNDPTFETSHIEARGYVPQNMIDGNLTTSYKADTTEAGYVLYTFSDELEDNRINIVQKSLSNAKVYLLAEHNGVRGYVDMGTLDKSLVTLSCNYDRNLALLIVWDANSVPNITEIVRYSVDDTAEPTVQPDASLNPIP